jgi:hypothetical protein
MRSIAHQFAGCSRGNVSGMKLPVKSERCLFTLKLNVEVWWIVISEIHSDDDPEKCRDNWHGYFLPDLGI